MKTKIILFSILVFLGGCASNTVSPVNIPTEIETTESAKPKLEDTQKGIEKSIEENIKAQEKIKSQNQTLLEQKINISEALVQAEKIKEKALAQQAISELEAVNLVNELKKIEARNLFLEKENKSLEEGIYNQVLILETTRNDARETMSKLIAKEEEAERRKAREADLEKTINLITSENKKLQKENAKLIKDSANAKVYKWWVIGGIIVIILLGAGYVVLRTYLPKIG